MKNIDKKNIKTTLEMLIRNYGGTSSLKCSFVIVRIIEELTFFHLDISPKEIEYARNIMNCLKFKE